MSMLKYFILAGFALGLVAANQNLLAADDDLVVDADHSMNRVNRGTKRDEWFRLVLDLISNNSN